MANEINGLLGCSDGGDTLTISEGSADDSTNTTTITVPSGQTKTVNIKNNGMGGLDTGDAAANTMYALYIVKGPLGGVGGVLSLNFDTPTLPGNFKFRRIGSVLTNANSQIVAYTQTGPGAERTVEYNANPNVLRVINAESALNWTDFPLAPPKPAEPGSAQLQVTPSGGATFLRASPDGSVITIHSPTTLGFTPPIGSNKGSFRTAPGASTTVRVVGFTETV